MFKILIIDEDITNNRKLEEILKNKPHYNLTIVSSVEKAKELIAPALKKDIKNEIKVEVKAESISTDPSKVVTAVSEEKTPSPLNAEIIFIDISKITKTLDSTLTYTSLQWYTDFREVLKAGGNENVPIILLSLSSDPIFIRSYLGPGVQNVFVKPVLSTLFEETLVYYSEGKKEQSRKMTPVKGIVEMYSQAVAKEISEFEIKVVTSKQVHVDEFKPIYGDFFKWLPERRVMSRCTDCAEDEETKGFFVETFSFVGVPPAITKEVRIWLKNQYVIQKKSNQKE